MAVTWTRETVQSEASAVLGWTAQQAYDFFGALVGDPSHTRYSNTTPYTDFFVDMLNAGVQEIHSHAPSRWELLSTTTVASSGSYDLPDYVIGTHPVRWVKYAGDTLERVREESLKAGELDNLDEDSIDSDGIVTGYIQEGTRKLRLVPRPSAPGTLKVLAPVMPARITSAAMTALLDLPGHLKTAPSYYVAEKAAAMNEGGADLARLYDERFWRLVRKKVSDDVETIDPANPPIPGAAWRAPDWDTDV